MSHPVKREDPQEMEDILSSIKKVVSKSMENQDFEAHDDQSPTSNVIELTRLVQDDGSIVDLDTIMEESFMTMDETAKEKDTTGDSGENQGSMDENRDTSPQTHAQTSVDQGARPEVLEDREVDEETRPQALEDREGEPLISENAIRESVQALHRLSTFSKQEAVEKSPPSSPQMGQKSLEALMKEILTPLLRNWLDANLPSLVKWIVTEEIQKILKASENQKDPQSTAKEA